MGKEADADENGEGRGGVSTAGKSAITQHLRFQSRDLSNEQCILCWAQKEKCKPEASRDLVNRAIYRAPQGHVCTMVVLNSGRDRLWFNGQCQSPLAVSCIDPGVNAEHFGLSWMINAHKQ